MTRAQELTIEALQAKLLDSERLRAELMEQRDATFRDPGPGGLYRMNDVTPMADSELVDDISLNALAGTRNCDMLLVTWSKIARLRWKLTSRYYQMDGAIMVGLPRSVRAEGWWHLCAQVGLIEPLARVLYYHPEAGQESAVAKAKPAQRGPIISCQGDYLDY